jgi:hypothetical protein
MTRQVGATTDAACILVLPTNFIVLVSSCFRVAHIQQRENEIKLIGDESAELSLDIFVSIRCLGRSEQVIRKV